MSIHIAGIGVAVPEHSIAQKDAAELMISYLHADGGRPRTVRALYARSGVAKRHSAVFESGEGPLPARQSLFHPARDANDRGPSTAARMALFEAKAPPLLADAARGALEDAVLGPELITHLITVSCTGFAAPGLDAALIQRLGLSPLVQRTHVGFMGCHGSLNGLRVAAAFTGADPSARVLMASVELCSLHLHYAWDPETVVANALFSDGAAAIVGVGEQGEDGGSGWRLVASGTHLFPESEGAMSWRVGDHGFEIGLSPAVPDLIETHAGPWVRSWLDEQGLVVEDVGSWAVHPGGPRVLTSFARAMDLERDSLSVSREVLLSYGNMSSATLPFILHRLRERQADRPVVAIAFGPGLVAEAALLV